MKTLNEISGVITSPFYQNQTKAAAGKSQTEIRARKGKRIVFTERHEFFLVVRWSIVRMV